MTLGLLVIWHEPFDKGMRRNHRRGAFSLEATSKIGLTGALGLPPDYENRIVMPRPCNEFEVLILTESFFGIIEMGFQGI